MPGTTCIQTPSFPFIISVHQVMINGKMPRSKIKLMELIKILEQLDRIERIVKTGKNVLTIEEAVEYTGISRSYLYKLTASGEIPFSKPRGKMIYFSKEKLDNWLLNNPSKSKAQIEQEALEYAFRNRRK